MATSHVWKFFRIGGLDQVAIESGADLVALKDLDQKLWVALSCPVKGLELDEKTLALIDTDKDGRIRVPELLAAIDWAALHLEDLGVLLRRKDALPLAAFKASTPEGKSALIAAKRILSNFGQPEATEITLAQASDTARIFSSTPFNGDGVITPDSTTDEALKLLVADIVGTIGGTTDRSGASGIDESRVATFYADLTAFAAWSEKGASADVLALGADTSAALTAIQAVRTKVDDYFSRTRLAAYDARALAALNRSETEYLALAAQDLSITTQEVAGFPLARIAADQPLPLLAAVNPAWAAALVTLHATAVTPVFGSAKTSLTEADWTALKAKVAAFEAWAGSKGGGSVEKLGLERVKALLAADQKAALLALIAQDKALDPEFVAITSVEKLLRFSRDFRALLNNFVNFFEFFSPDHYANFQAGTLYLDTRSTEFCIKVAAPSPLAAMSKAFIAYVDCKRAGEAPIKVAACFTNGDSDYLFVGRNGVFYDRQGRDWDASITSIADNPISIRQAFLSPYKKFVRMIEEQVAKRAAAADAESNAKLATAAETAANADKKAAGPKPEPKKMDIGTVAAMGVAVGAIGGALGAIATGLAKLTFWQLPLVFIGLIAVISGPSMLIAWLKLRQRNIGPILEANGWAINGRVKINIPFGTKLTERAVLPNGSKRDLNDPYSDKEAIRRQKLIWTLIVVAILAASVIRWDEQKNGHYFWQPAPKPVVVVAPITPVVEAPVANTPAPTP
ncbi:hypothetical protein [Rariglobus hedericola]|uniref:hypothetical protein n=2 Tax=Rariglobus hedericola TaxID=2597822 RepID=UPI00193A4BF8|nr:hypothetical protein [Rariglobus hedericola]